MQRADRTTPSISKILSANDAGETGAHQAGILVPRRPEILSFFPALDTSQLNPRHHLIFSDEGGGRWEFAFIYYNNNQYGGTRDEFRLTRMTPFLRESGVRSGDEIILECRETRYFIKYRRANSASRGKDGVLRLGSSWRVVDIK